MPKIDSRTILTADAPERLDVFLARSLPDYSRSYLQKLCKEGRVSVDEEVVTKTSTDLHVGQKITIELPVSTPKVGDIPVLYEDDDVIVMNKPTGMLSHTKGAMSDEFTVADFVRTRTTDGLDTNRPGIVHRLDRGTSGVIIAAKNPEAKHWLQKQFSTRKVKKTYTALVTGHLTEPTAMIQLPIERNPKQPQTFRVGGNGKSAETTYQVFHSYLQNDLVHLMPHTGRTHQLRVHLHYLGHPIVGDDLYGTAEPTLGRMFLHASKLELTLPSRERKVFEAPLPPNLQSYLEHLA